MDYACQGSQNQLLASTLFAEALVLKHMQICNQNNRLDSRFLFHHNQYELVQGNHSLTIIIITLLVMSMGLPGRAAILAWSWWWWCIWTADDYSTYKTRRHSQSLNPLHIAVVSQIYINIGVVVIIVKMHLLTLWPWSLTFQPQNLHVRHF